MMLAVRSGNSCRAETSVLMKLSISLKRRMYSSLQPFLVIEPALLVRIGGIRLFRWREADLFADWYVFTVFVLRVEMLVIKFLIVLHNSFLL